MSLKHNGRHFCALLALSLSLSVVKLPTEACPLCLLDVPQTTENGDMSQSLLFGWTFLRICLFLFWRYLWAQASFVYMIDFNNLHFTKFFPSHFIRHHIFLLILPSK